MRKSERRKEQHRISSTSSSDDGNDKIFSLGYDVAIRILLFLPLKSLFVSKCVSKTWLTAISDPYFAKLKSAICTPISGLLKQPRSNTDRIAFITDRTSEEATAIKEALASLTINGENVFILDSTKGLLLCANKKAKHYFVYNTLTKHYVSVPIPFLCSRRSRKFVKLIWEENQQQLKIIQFSENWKRRTELHIFSQEKWKWKMNKVALSWPEDTFPLISIPILVHKTFYWINDYSNLFAYNMEQEELYFLQIPDHGEPHSLYPWHLCESQGTLYYIEKYSLTKYVISVWMLQNEESSTWDLAHRFDIQSICIANIINDDEKNFVQFIPLSLHSTNPNLLFVNITPSKFGVLNMHKLELTLVLDLQVMVGVVSGGLYYSKYFLNTIFDIWLHQFEEPVWMLSLPRGPLYLPYSKSSLCRYLACSPKLK